MQITNISRKEWIMIPNVSVIIPTYNRKHLILDALAQLKQQTLKEIEFIIIDDGSDDNSYDLLYKETKQDKRFIILKQEHQGPSIARNKGLLKAHGQYIGFFDIDDKIPNNYFSDLYHIADKQKADIVYTSYNSIPHRCKSAVTRADRIKSLRNGAIWDKLYKRELITNNHIQFAEGLYTADNLWCVQTFSYAEKVVLVNSPSYLYDLHPDSIGKDKTKINKRKNDIFTVISLIKLFCESVGYTAEETDILIRFLRKSYDCYPSDKKYSKKLYQTLGIKYTRLDIGKSLKIKMFLLKLVRFFHIISKEKYKERRYISLIGVSSLFDKNWYLEQNPDVKAKKISAASHYFKYGWKEGRNPSQLFDGNRYLTDNADVTFYGICPLVHYLTNGEKEGRGYVSISGQSYCGVIPIQKKKNIFLQKVHETLTYPLRVKDECEDLKEAIQIKSQTTASAPSSTEDNVAVQFVTYHPEHVSESSKTIIVKNAEGNPDTTAEIIIQNQINYTPKVSVIIPVYNVEQYLRECLDSIVNQTLKDIEVICVDDGSTDSSLDILKEYAKKDNRITIITQKNLYAGVARNAGLTVAKGEYLSFLDSDDFFELTLFEETYNIAQKEKSEIVFYKYTYYDDKSQTKEREAGISTKYTDKQIYTIKTKKLKNDLFRICEHTPWNKLINRELVTKEKIYFQSLKSSNDTYFAFLVLACSKKISLYYKSLLYYRYDREGSLVKNRDKFPFGFYYAYTGLHHALEEKNLYATYKKTFLTSFLCTSLWTISKTDLAQKDVKNLIRDKIIPEYKIFGKNRRMITKSLLRKLTKALSLDNAAYKDYRPSILGDISAYIFLPYYFLQLSYLHNKYRLVQHKSNKTI